MLFVRLCYNKTVVSFTIYNTIFAQWGWSVDPTETQVQWRDHAKTEWGSDVHRAIRTHDRAWIHLLCTVSLQYRSRYNKTVMNFFYVTIFFRGISKFEPAADGIILLFICNNKKKYQRRTKLIRNTTWGCRCNTNDHPLWYTNKCVYKLCEGQL